MEAIREIDPDRCIIADISSSNTGESITAPGVALSSHCTWPEDYLFSYFDLGSAENTIQRSVWPYEKAGKTVDARGYGWCYTNWYGFVGIACVFPLVTSTTYTRMPDNPLYIDDEMMALFQKVNGA